MKGFMKMFPGGSVMQRIENDRIDDKVYVQECVGSDNMK